MVLRKNISKGVEVMKSIDDATPEEWNNLNRKDTADWDGPNDHPVYGENIPDNSLGKSYANLINTMVDHPPHYNKTGVECIDAIKAMTDEGFEHYLQGNIMKYLWRYRYKNGAEDLKKAQWYLNELIDVVEDDNKS